MAMIVAGALHGDSSDDDLNERCVIVKQQLKCHRRLNHLCGMDFGYFADALKHSLEIGAVLDTEARHLRVLNGRANVAKHELNSRLPRDWFDVEHEDVVDPVRVPAEIAEDPMFRSAEMNLESVSMLDFVLDAIAPDIGSDMAQLAWGEYYIDIVGTYRTNCNDSAATVIAALPGFAPKAVRADAHKALERFRQWPRALCGRRGKFALLLCKPNVDYGYRRVLATFGPDTAHEYSCHSVAMGQCDHYVSIYDGHIVRILQMDGPWTFVTVHIPGGFTLGWVPSAFLSSEPLYIVSITPR